MDSGIVDSIGILDIVNFTNEEFQVAVADEELLPENLDSVDSIAMLVTDCKRLPMPVRIM